jgi:serine/threonine protein kinase
MARCLGTGTFGRVFVAKYKETVSVSVHGRSHGAEGANSRRFFWAALLTRSVQGAYVAVKKLKKVEVLRLKQVEHVMNEKAILLGLTHPFIVNLWATFQDLGSLYLVMEFVQGGEVFSHLRKLGRFSPEITRVFSAEVCLALEHLHSFDVIYRDL